MGELGGHGLSDRPAIFLDRDGVIVDPVVRSDTDGRAETPLDPDAIRLSAGAAGGIRALRRVAWLLVVVSNQPAAAKGETDRAGLRAVHERIVTLLARCGARIDEWRYCLHHPDAVDPLLRGPCDCRKPAPGLLLDAAVDLGIDLEGSWMVGDTSADAGAARAAGVRFALIEHPGSAHRRNGKEHPDLRVADLSAFADRLAVSR